MSDVNTSPWRIIWKLDIPPKLKNFIWVVAHGKLLTNVQRMKRHLTMDDSCFTCQSDKETLAHLFRDCHFSKNVWESFHKPTVVCNLSEMH
jgi:glutamine phosphoribosylpyrophosphate amidotransferase